MDTLLHFKADVNYDDGIPNQIAALYGNVPMLEKLCGFRPTQRSLSIAFSLALTVGHDEELLLEPVDAMMSNTPAKPDPKFQAPDYDSPLFLAL